MVKRTVLILVEGPSDADVLVPPVRRRYEKTRIVDGAEFHFDVTTIRLFPGDAKAAGLTACRDPRDAIRDKIRQYTESGGGCPWARISHIAHVVDLDGAFVDSSHVAYSPANHRAIYTDNQILTDNVPFILKRNEEKSLQLNKLCSVPHIAMNGRRVPYRIFYMSRNLEHAFLGKEQNLSDAQKERYASLLNAEFKKDGELFEEVIEKLWGLHGSLGWKDSWQYVREDCHSLERGSNFHLLDEFLSAAEPVQLLRRPKSS